MKQFHKSNMGKYAPVHFADAEGYISYDDTLDLSGYTLEQLAEMSEDDSLDLLLRSSAAVALAERRIAEWRTHNIA